MTERTPLGPIAQQALQSLMREWFDFERRLEQVPIIQRLQRGTFTREDYRALLLHLRQQVVEGSRWIARSAASFEREHAALRSVVLGHAVAEHRDYEMLERDYVAMGGLLEDIVAQPKNPGSEALHGFLMYRAGRSNPFDMLGAMWIIEGLGNKMAHEWAERITALLGDSTPVSFMRYHASNDGEHLEEFYALLDRVCTSTEIAESILMTAKVVARLYALQLCEIDLGGR